MNTNMHIGNAHGGRGRGGGHLPYPRVPPPPHVHRCHHCHRPQALPPLLPLPWVPVLPLPCFAGATTATGAIANTAAVSTGAVFMGIPSLPPPPGRQTSDHSLDAEQDISTAASAIASAAGATSMGTASATVEYDSLSRRAQMIILMDRNASNASNESLSASYVKNMYDSVMR